jgi:hypothetical protein
MSYCVVLLQGKKKMWQETYVNYDRVIQNMTTQRFVNCGLAIYSCKIFQAESCPMAEPHILPGLELDCK